MKGLKAAVDVGCDAPEQRAGRVLAANIYAHD
jgi:hypothetical protein